MKLLRSLLLSLFSVVFVTTFAQTDQVVLSVNETTPGSLWNLNVGFENSQTNYTAFQMDLVLPEGFEWDQSSLQADMRLMGFQCSASVGVTGVLRVVVYSANNVEIPGATGNLFHLSFRPIGKVSDGSYPIIAHNIRFAKRDGTEVGLDRVTFDFNYKKPEVIRNFTVVYMVDGVEYQRQTVQEGTRIPAIEVPVKEGYTFKGWEDVPATMPAEDICIYGSFDCNLYTIYYYLDGEQVGIQKIYYGDKIVPMTVEDTDERIFLGWEGLPSTMPAHDLTIYGKTEPTGIETLTAEEWVKVYTQQGKLILDSVTWRQAQRQLSRGLYIVNAQKVFIK